MGNTSEKPKHLSASCRALHRAHSSPTTTNHRRSLSTSDRQQQNRHKSISSSGSESPPASSRPRSARAAGAGGSELVRDSLRRQALRSSTSRASNPNIKIDPNSLNNNGGGGKYLSYNHRDLIRGNWDATRRYDLCRRIYLRAFGKRPEVRRIFETSSGDDQLWRNEICAFADFLQSIIAEMILDDDFTAIREISLEFGRRHAQYRTYGFKSEFWVTLAEATTKECCYLDAAVHPPGDVLDAWSKLVGFVFGWIRDGYYDGLRTQRQSNRKASTMTSSISQNSLLKSAAEEQARRQRTKSLESEESLLVSPQLRKKKTTMASSNGGGQQQQQQKSTTMGVTNGSPSLNSRRATLGSATAGGKRGLLG